MIMRLANGRYSARSLSSRTHQERQERMFGGSEPAGHGCPAIMGYHLGGAMTDLLIRDVPDDVVAAVDARASRLGLSRSEYVRRRLAQDAASAGAVVSTGDLDRFSELFGDLNDPDVMSQAWR
jgi:hypothetical protein